MNAHSGPQISDGQATSTIKIKAACWPNLEDLMSTMLLRLQDIVKSSAEK